MSDVVRCAASNRLSLRDLLHWRLGVRLEVAASVASPRRDLERLTIIRLEPEPEAFHRLTFDPALLCKLVVIAAIEDEAFGHIGPAAGAFFHRMSEVGGRMSD